MNKLVLIKEIGIKNAEKMDAINKDILDLEVILAEFPFPNGLLYDFMHENNLYELSWDKNYKKITCSMSGENRFLLNWDLTSRIIVHQKWEEVLSKIIRNGGL